MEFSDVNRLALGWPEQGQSGFTPAACEPQVVEHADPGMGGDPQRVVVVQQLDQTMARRHVHASTAEGASQLVERDQRNAVVAAEVVRIAGVVHAMMLRRAEQELDRARQFADQFGMQPELAKQVHRQCGSTPVAAASAMNMVKPR